LLEPENNEDIYAIMNQYKTLTVKLKEELKPLITVEKNIYSDFDLVELKAKIESLEEALEEENQLATRATINRFESSTTDIHDLNIKIHENPNETHNRLKKRQENRNTTHNTLHQLETQYQVTKTANQNLNRQLWEMQAEIRERQVETWKRNMERKYHELRTAIDNFERNQRADKSQLNLTMLEFEATITERDEKIHKQLGQNSHSLTTYIDKNVAAVRKESKT